MERIQIQTPGIKRILQRYDRNQAIAEYIWNGFDAKADTVELKYDANDFGAVESIEIIDNGYGIVREELDVKFKPFFETQKILKVSDHGHQSNIHGKNGVGRLTFFVFADEARWQTRYKTQEVSEKYEIKVTADGLDSYEIIADSISNEIADITGTTVTFFKLAPLNEADLKGEVVDYLAKEFCWFLELNKEKGYRILINGEELDYSHLMRDTDSTEVGNDDLSLQFSMRFVRWSGQLNREYSKQYYIDSNGDEKWNETTKLNNKGDNFFHSIFVQSDYFDDFNFGKVKDKNQKSLLGGTKTEDKFKYIEKQIIDYLKEKRRPFLFSYANKLVDEYKQAGVFPQYGDNEWEEIKLQELEDSVKAIVVTEPSLFNRLNIAQKKTFVRLLSLLLDTNERDSVIDIIEEITLLSQEQRADLASVLRATSLSRVINTIKLIEDRYKTFLVLKDLVYTDKYGVNERDHIQKIVEKAFWLFGEEYALVTADKRLDTSLRKYLSILDGNNNSSDIAVANSHNKRMDIFLTRRDLDESSIKNVVLELKRPDRKIGIEELQQLEKYMDTVLETPEFNDKAEIWHFYLIGREYKDTQIQRRIKSGERTGEKSLTLESDNAKLFVKTWSEVFNEFEQRFNFLDRQLKLERDKLASEFANADEATGYIQQLN